MIHLILFGPPGSGKGTQAIKLAEKYGLYHISTGDLFRSETQNKTPLGLKALEYMSQGQLVPDAVTIAMLQSKVQSMPDVTGFIYDGFPRTVPQAEALDDMLNIDGESIMALIALEVDDDEIVSRILNRGLTSGRSDDNDESIIRKRMEEYRKKTSVVFEHYAKSDKSFTINGIGTIDQIFYNLCELIDSKLQ